MSNAHAESARKLYGANPLGCLHIKFPLLLETHGKISISGRLRRKIAENHRNRT